MENNVDICYNSVILINESPVILFTDCSNLTLTFATNSSKKKKKKEI